MDSLRENFAKEKEFKAERVIAYLLILLFVLVGVRSFLENNSLNVVISVIGIIFVLGLDWLSKKINKYFISIFIPLINIFLFIAMYLGSIKGFYGIFWWWDVVAHTLSGVILSLLGFIIIFILDQEIDFTDNRKLILSILFSASLGIAGGAIWEIYEFSAGIFLGLNMQSGGLLDTMKDIISDTVGAIFTSVGFGVYIKIQLAEEKDSTRQETKPLKD